MRIENSVRGIDPIRSFLKHAPPWVTGLFGTGFVGEARHIQVDGGKAVSEMRVLSTRARLDIPRSVARVIIELPIRSPFCLMMKRDDDRRGIGTRYRKRNPAYP
jgi:hypothetical protein